MTTLVSGATYERIALAQPEKHWELHCGRLVEKPPVTVRHAETIHRLYRRIAAQLPEADYSLRGETGRLRRGEGSYFEADFCVVPRAYVEQMMRDHPDALEVYNQPLPLIVEVWSPSTGGYDVDTKIPEYQRRGDLEIWRLHPRQCSLTTWRRQPDGSYSETVFTGGIIRPVALPNIAIDLDSLFDQP